MQYPGKTCPQTRKNSLQINWKISSITPYLLCTSWIKHAPDKTILFVLITTWSAITRVLYQLPATNLLHTDYQAYCSTRTLQPLYTPHSSFPALLKTHNTSTYSCRMLHSLCEAHTHFTDHLIELSLAIFYIKPTDYPSWLWTQQFQHVLFLRIALAWPARDTRLQLSFVPI